MALPQTRGGDPVPTQTQAVVGLSNKGSPLRVMQMKKMKNRELFGMTFSGIRSHPFHCLAPCPLTLTLDLAPCPFSFALSLAPPHCPFSLPFSPPSPPVPRLFILSTWFALLAALVLAFCVLRDHTVIDPTDPEPETTGPAATSTHLSPPDPPLATSRHPRQRRARAVCCATSRSLRSALRCAGA